MLRVHKFPVGTQTIPKSVVPNYRRKPNSAFLKLIKSQFMRARHGIYHLCSNEAILTPSISTRLYKTLQRSTVLYAIEFVDWDVDQIKELEITPSQSSKILSKFRFAMSTSATSFILRC